MWQQLGLAALKGVQDDNNRRQDLQSNIITQKYSPWTGQQANFKSQGGNNMLSTMMGGYGAGLASEALAKDQETLKGWIEAQGKAAPAVAAAASSPAITTPAARGPAVLPGGNNIQTQSAFESAIPSAGQGNPWLDLAKQQAPQAPYQGYASETGTGPMQAPVDPTSKLRQSLWGMLPDSMPIKRGW